LPKGGTTQNCPQEVRTIKGGEKINIAVEKLLTRAASGKKINQG